MYGEIFIVPQLHILNDDMGTQSTWFYPKYYKFFIRVMITYDNLDSFSEQT